METSNLKVAGKKCFLLFYLEGLTVNLLTQEVEENAPLLSRILQPQYEHQELACLPKHSHRLLSSYLMSHRGQQNILQKCVFSCLHSFETIDLLFICLFIYGRDVAIFQIWDVMYNTTMNIVVYQLFVLPSNYYPKIGFQRYWIKEHNVFRTLITISNDFLGCPPNLHFQ